MKRLFSIVVALCVGVMSLSAQQNLWQGEGLKSPEVNADGSVTFRLFAPEAESVKVTGDFLPEVKLKWEHGEAMVAGEAELERKENGVWEFRSEPLRSELYFYSFIVDGMRDVRDPSNIYMMRDVGSQMNYFIIPGERGKLYSANESL